jgi:hypothetical protein
MKIFIVAIILSFFVGRSGSGGVKVLPEILADKLGGVVVLDHFLGSFLGKPVGNVSLKPVCGIYEGGYDAHEHHEVNKSFVAEPLFEDGGNRSCVGGVYGLGNEETAYKRGQDKTCVSSVPVVYDLSESGVFHDDWEGSFGSFTWVEHLVVLGYFEGVDPSKEGVI